MRTIETILGMALIGTVFFGSGSAQVMSNHESYTFLCQSATERLMVVGTWCLVDLAADESKPPEHGMYLGIYTEGTGYRGAVPNFATREEIRPLKAVQFDGTNLRLQLTGRDLNSQAEMPWLVMTLNNGRFEGFYLNSANEPRGPKLKLIRVKQ
jgi:hypothetical protein